MYRLLPRNYTDLEEYDSIIRGLDASEWSVTLIGSSGSSPLLEISIQGRDRTENSDIEQPFINEDVVQREKPGLSNISLQRNNFIKEMDCIQLRRR